MSYERIVSRCFKNLKPEDAAGFVTFDNQAATMLNVKPGFNIVNSLVTMVEGVHFLSSIKAEDLAYKAIAASYSKLMALGAKPLCLHCNISIPEVNIVWLDSFSRGLQTSIEQYGGSLVGASVVTGKTSIAISAIGEVNQSVLLESQDRVEVGDLIYVTGSLGDSGLALKRTLQNIPNDDTTSKYLERCLMRPNLPLQFAVAARNHFVLAVELMSGFLQDFERIIQTERIGAHVELDKIPLSDEIVAIIERNAAYQCAFTGSDDCQLCFIVKPKNVPDIKSLASQFNTKISCVGKLVAEPGFKVFDVHGDEFVVKRPDHDHFAILDDCENDDAAR